jgi:hypothetical protein
MYQTDIVHSHLSGVREWQYPIRMVGTTIGSSKAAQLLVRKHLSWYNATGLVSSMEPGGKEGVQPWGRSK